MKKNVLDANADHTDLLYAGGGSVKLSCMENNEYLRAIIRSGYGKITIQRVRKTIRIVYSGRAGRRIK